MMEGSPDPQPDAAVARCEECGAYGAQEVGDRHLCPECRIVQGSCCPEFGHRVDTPGDARAS
jgi:hypothetical protein